MVDSHTEDSNRSEKRTTAFQWLLIGVIIGMLFGVLTYPLWGMPGSYQAQIATGFWGLIGGGLSLVIRLAYQMFRRSSKR